MRRDPRALVAAMAIEDLATLVAGDGVFAVLEDEVAGFRFKCPGCHRLDANGGTAQLVDAWRWRCHVCRNFGTRFQLERLVLEDADLISQAYSTSAESTSGR
jgi:predicted RNA-binding Zn-ribbon protein involved in translation (DUF1610 family)